jgi:Zn-dependent peptidase ImmA (M78 family)
MEDNGSAASFVNDSGAAILLNRKNVPWRRHFDIAHELYHIFTWYYYDFKSKNYNLSDNDFEEKVANAFAAELLMPEDTVKNEIDTLHSRNEIDSFFVLQTSIKFQVSLEAFAARLEFLGYIKKGGKNNLIDKNIKKEFWNQYNLENSQEEELQDEDEFPFSYLMLAYSAYKKTKLTKMKFAKYLNKNIGEIDYYLKQRGLY